MKFSARMCLVAMGCALAPAFAFAQSTTVNASDNIYASGSQSELVTNCSAPSINYCGAGGQGTLPGYISVTGGTYVNVLSTGTITLNGGGATNDPDGLTGGAPAYLAVSTNSGFESLSGISAPGGGYVVGVFVGPDGPSGTAPASLTYTSTTTDLASYDPLLDQVFFIGDGLTGDGSGTAQDFYVPAGATELYLGISDACNFVGPPSCYGDNSDVTTDGFSVNVTSSAQAPPPPPSATPEPSSLMLLGTGVLGAAGVLRRRIHISR